MLLKYTFTEFSRLLAGLIDTDDPAPDTGDDVDPEPLGDDFQPGPGGALPPDEDDDAAGILVS